MKKTISIFMAFLMVLSFPVFAYAGSGNVEVNGHIGVLGDLTIDPDGNGGGTYDITYSASVHWWVTQDDSNAVVNGTAAGPADVVNIIQNNNTAVDVKVSLDSFVPQPGDAKDTAMQDNLILELTGDLAADEMNTVNLTDGYDGPKNYTKNLEGGPENAWVYGFGGSYKAKKLTKSFSPKYTMTLGFKFV